MFKIAYDKKITMVQGDTGVIRMRIHNHELSLGDEVKFAIVNKANPSILLCQHSDKKIVLEKKVTVFEKDGSARIVIYPYDTEYLQPGKYLYEIQVTTKDGRIDTVVPLTGFTLMEGCIQGVPGAGIPGVSDPSLPGAGTNSSEIELRFKRLENEIIPELGTRITNVENEIDSVSSSLDNKVNILDVVKIVNVKSFGAKGDGVTDDAKAINSALLYAKQNKIMNVYIPKGQYLINSESIKVHTGITFYGDGSDDPYNYGGTRLYGGDNLNEPIVTNDGTLYHFKWFDMQVRNSKSHGAYLIDLGENTYIDRIAFYDNRGDGLKIGNNGNLTPCHLGHISTHKNDGAGIRFTNANSTSIQILYLSMDNNLECGMAIDIGDTSTTVQILNWKSERWNGGQTDYQLRQKTVFNFKNLNGGTVHLGQGRVHLGSGMVDSDGGIIHQTFTSGNSVGYVMWDCITKSPNASDTSYAFGYKDEKNNEIIPFKDILRRTFVSGLNVQIAQTRGTLLEIGRADTKLLFGKVTGLPTYNTPYGTLVVIGNKIYINTNNTTGFDRLINNNYDEDFTIKSGRGLVLTSSNYTKYRLKVDNDGNLTTEKI